MIMFPNSKFPEIGLFFDSSDKLLEQFVFMDKSSLESFKSALKCKWNETEEMRKNSSLHENNQKRSLF